MLSNVTDFVMKKTKLEIKQCEKCWKDHMDNEDLDERTDEMLFPMYVMRLSLIESPKGTRIEIKMVCADEDCGREEIAKQKYSELEVRALLKLPAVRKAMPIRNFTEPEEDE